MTNWQERLAKELAAPDVRREMAVGRASAALSTLIAQRLVAKGMTQEQLAMALGITPGAVSRKLKEGCDMRLSSVAAILWALDVPLYRELERLCDERWAGVASDTTVVDFASRPSRRIAGPAVVTPEVGTAPWSVSA